MYTGIPLEPIGGRVRAEGAPETAVHVVEGPGAHIEHSADSEGFIALVFAESLRTHASLHRGLAGIDAFLRAPGAEGVAPLGDHTAAQGRFVYRTQASISLAELLAFTHRSSPCGGTAAVDIALQVSGALQRVSKRAATHGVPCHGCLNPWRVFIDADGRVDVLGYGLPDVELFAYLDQEQPGVSVDTLRYAPPERLDDHEEDARSDLYTLGIIVAEMVLGRPVFDGPADRVAERVINGDAPELIEALGTELEEEILDLLCIATERDPDHRFGTHTEFIGQARQLVGSVGGEALVTLVQRALFARDPEDDLTEVASLPTEVVDLTSLEDEEQTESGLDADFELVAEVPELPPDATLDAVRQHARAIVDRARQLAEQAGAMEIIAVQRTHNLAPVAPVVRKLKEAVQKANKAATSTANTARLVELDDTLEDARVTLKMVRNAEKLCYSATGQALEVLFRVQAEVDQMREAAQALERARRRSSDAAQRARVHAREARELLAELEAAAYDVDLAADLMRSAKTAAMAATAAAAKAKKSSDAASGPLRPPEATRESERTRHAADEAKDALETIRGIQRTLLEAEAEVRERKVARLRSCIARTRSAASSAADSLSRAQNAAEHATIPAGAGLLETMTGHADAARRAAETCAALVEADVEVIDDTLTEAEQLLAHAESQRAECSALSDHLVALAGEAAAAEAELSKWKTEARATLERAQPVMEAALQRWETLSADTAEVTARTARDALQIAARAASELLEVRAGFRQAVKAISAATSPDGLEDQVRQLVELEREALALADRTDSRCREARGAASRELEELARRDSERRELQTAIDRARGHAERCKQSVEAAWSAYEETVEVLSTAPIEGAERLRARAYEIIDIAEFQAGEAENAAEEAAAQGDPNEARSHANTAASFEERIAQDLPEALQILERARTQATEEIGRLESARTETREVLSRTRDVLRSLEEQKLAAREASAAWNDPQVHTHAEALDSLGEGVDVLLTDARFAAQSAQGAESAAAAEPHLPTARAVLERIEHLASQATALSNALDEAVRQARSEAEMREAAHQTVTQNLAAVERMRTALGERAQALRSAIAQHKAHNDEVSRASTRMTEATETGASAEADVREAMKGLIASSTGVQAQECAEASIRALERITEAVEVAAEAQSQGVHAAEREALNREEGERRRLESARATALGHVKTAKQAAEKGVALLRDANAELVDFDDPEVGRLHTRAKEWVRVARTNATSALKAARKCQRAKVAAAAVEWEQRANGLASDAANAVTQAAAVLRDAVDMARRAEQEAAALERVKSEIQSIAVMIAEGVQQAEEDSARVSEITAGSVDPETLACNGTAESLVASVKRSAAKIETAAPMALQADSLEVAQGMLDTCRAALERADETADQVRDLIQTATTLRSEEAQRAAARLDEARTMAMRPAEEARTVAEKCSDWMQLGKQLAESHQGLEPVQAAVIELELATLEAEALADQAEATAKPARVAPSIEEAEAIAEAVREVTAKTEDAAQRAKSALDALRASIDRAAEDAAQAVGLRQTATEHANAAEVAANEATRIAEELEAHVSAHPGDTTDATEALRTVKTAAKAVTAAASKAFELTEQCIATTDLAEVEALLQSIAAQQERAESAMLEAREADQQCREALQNAEKRSREEQKRQKDEALRAKLRKRRSESQIMKREELKARFQQREHRAEPNLSSLRERLRARRRSGSEEPARQGRRTPVRPDTSPIPRGRMDRRRRRPDESSRFREDEDELTLPPPEPSGPRSREERQASRERREERRRTRRRVDSDPEDLAPDPPTNMGLINPSNDVDNNEGADALLRRLRRKRRED